MVFSNKEEIQRIVGERNGEDTKLKRMEKRGEGDEDAAQRGSERRKEGRKERYGREEKGRATKERAPPTPLSKYFYDVAAFRGSLVKKGFPFVGRDTIAKCFPSRYDSISSAHQPPPPIGRSFEPTTLFFPKFLPLKKLNHMSL